VTLAVGYARVSTFQQAGEKHSSLPEQEAAINRYCAENGLQLETIFVDVARGGRNDRKHYLEMLAYIAQHDVDTVLVRWIDRFGRTPREMLRRIWELEEEQSVEVAATDEDIREELVLLMKVGIAGHESRRAAERIKMNLLNAARKGVHFGTPAYGHKRVVEVSQDGKEIIPHLEVDPDEQAIVLEMVRMTLVDEWGARTIANELNSRGVRTRQGKPWSADGVRRTLTSPTLAGINRYGHRSKGMDTILAPEAFPPVIDIETWRNVCKRIAERGKGGHPGQIWASRYLLTGVLRCAHCRGPMTGRQGNPYTTASGERIWYPAYWCGNYQRSVEFCGVSNGQACARTDLQVLEKLAEYVDPAKVRALFPTETEGPTKAELAEVERIDRELKKLADGLLKDVARVDKGTYTRKEFEQVQAHRHQQQAELEARREAILPSVEAKAYVRSAAEKLIATLPRAIGTFLEEFDRLEPPQRKAMLGRMVEAIYIGRDTPLEIVFRTE
jgi:DNA invertase Pin-like site-specific DNA recombinase